MPEKKLHLLAFNIPYPADYGGVIDIFYKIRALQRAGVDVILHCYAYGRQTSKELEDLCYKVHYYPRASGFSYFLKKDPYIVVTRNANTVPENLLRDRYPVLFEGLHTTACLDQCLEAGKKVIVRAHNIEHEYYNLLSRSERRWPDKLFLRLEAAKLKRYESILDRAHHILAISRKERTYFEQHYGSTHFVPAFHRYEEVAIKEGKGSYILFHGNLGVAENSDVFLRIAENALSKLSHPVVVAGKNPSASFERKLARWPHISLEANPTDQEMDNLIQNAHINLLYTAQSTGIKLKLLHTLFGGRHCIANSEMIQGTGLGHLCHIAERPEEMVRTVEKLMDEPFGQDQIKLRVKALQEYSNESGAQKIIRLL